MIGLGPGQQGSLGPIPASPRFDAGVGGSVPLGSAHRGPLVAQRVVAPGKARPASGQTAHQTAHRAQRNASSPAPGVAPEQIVAVAPSAPSAPAPEPKGAGEEAPSVGATTGEAPPEGASSPVSSPLPSSGVGPVTAGVEPKSCEGDEYVVTIELLSDAEEGEEASLEIVVRRLEEGSSIEDLTLEGTLLDVQNLMTKLTSEGSCVQLEVTFAAEKGEVEGVPSDGASPSVAPAEGTPSTSLHWPDEGDAARASAQAAAAHAAS